MNDVLLFVMNKLISWPIKKKKLIKKTECQLSEKKEEKKEDKKNAFKSNL